MALEENELLSFIVHLDKSVLLETSVSFSAKPRSLHYAFWMKTGLLCNMLFFFYSYTNVVQMQISFSF